MGPRPLPSPALPPRRERRIGLDREPDALARAVRILGAASAVAILRTLAKARRQDPDGGWMFLSEIAASTGEAPGSVGLTIEKLRPFVAEKRERGRRYFRSRVADVALAFEEYEHAGPF